MTAIMGLRRLVVVVMIFIGLALGASAGFYVYLKVSGNFHIVEQGQVYRSGQLSGAALDQAVASYGIRSVLNLRGASPGESWYDDEVAVSRARGVAHYDYGINAERLVSVAQAEEILLAIRNAPKPILIHCKAGSDRTGLVSALYLFSRGEVAKKAERELSLRYGHFPYLVGGTGVMDDSFHAYVGDSLLRKTGRTLGAFPTRVPQGTTNMKAAH
ncbi:MAG: dual specificity protein phosphatase family protein [Sulfuricella sp.]